MPTCYLVGASPEIEDAPQVSLGQVCPGDFIIAADGGCAHLRRWGIAPDFVIGDMDSLAGELPEGVPAAIFPSEKNETDMELALQEGLRRGFRRLVLLGACGGRPDHTMANVQLLVQAAQQGASAVLHMGGWRCTAICAPGGNSSLKLNGKGMVSVFAYGAQAHGVVITGLKYPLAGETLDGAVPRGTSNELDGEGTISLDEGTLLCCWEAQILPEFFSNALQRLK